MNRTVLATVFAALALPAASLAQMGGMAMPATLLRRPRPAPRARVLRSYSAIKPNLIKAAEKMPDADFRYAPTPDIRTFARIVNHVTEAQSHTSTTRTGTAFDAKMVAERYRR